MNNVLEFSNVTIRYESDMGPVITQMSFAITAGERVALIGLNGSGKTTLLLAVVGLVPHEGRILIEGTILERKTVTRVRDQIGFLFNVPEDQLLFPKVIEDVSFGLLRRGMTREEVSEKAGLILNRLGLGHLTETPLHHLSHGQKQRVALAGALITGPPLLLLDEPSAGLDPPGKRDLAAIMSDLPATMLVATHDLDFASTCCSRFIMLEHGRLVSDSHDTIEAVRRWKL
ncbi:ABC transporter ATP-binding protein [bacterium]|nr:ABC transporter ATP-binding protein [bacterium]